MLGLSRVLAGPRAGSGTLSLPKGSSQECSSAGCRWPAVAGGQTPRRVRSLGEEQQLPGVFLIYVRLKTAAFRFVSCTSARASLTSSSSAASTGAPSAGPAPLVPPEHLQQPKRALRGQRTWWIRRKGRARADNRNELNLLPPVSPSSGAFPGSDPGILTNRTGFPAGALQGALRLFISTVRFVSPTFLLLS